MSKSEIAFNETGFERQGETNGVMVWFTPKGDGLGLFHYPTPPDIKADLKTVKTVRAFYKRIARESKLGVIEIDTVVVDGCPAVRTLFKLAQQPKGRTYLASLTIPFRDFSYVFKVQCEELEVTGIRDTVVSMNLMSEGVVGFDAKSGTMTGWLDDPYDQHETGPMTRNKSERREYDSQFPEHPLSRARRVLDLLERTVAIDESVKKQPAFEFRR